MFEDFFGNHRIRAILERMIEQDRIPHTLLFHGPEGVGKATLARRFAAVLLGDPEKIEQDDLSRPENRERLAEREKMPADRRVEDPLLFASHPDFITFPPDGPLRQISIHQMRRLKDLAQYKPHHGRRRVFLIDRFDRANENAENSLLKILEEPPEHLLLILTAENVYDLLPTIRSRSVQFHFAPLSPEEMREFVRRRGLDEPERRVALAGGCPGAAVSLDLAAYDLRRETMLGLLETSARSAKFTVWAGLAEELSAGDKLDDYLKVLYLLLEDLVLIQQGQGGLHNFDVRDRLEPLAERVGFDWIRAALEKTDELMQLVRRNIQKTIALDAMVLGLRSLAR